MDQPEKVSYLPRTQTYEEKINMLQQQRYVANGYADLWKTRAKVILATLGIIVLLAIGMKFVIWLFFGSPLIMQ